VGDAFDVETGGRGGDDKLYGTGFMVGDSELGMASAFGGDDLLDAFGATLPSELFGDVRFNDLDGTSVGGRDRLLGGAFDDLLVGDAGEDVGDGATGGDDLLQGNGGDDALFGDARDDLVEAAAGGDDVVRGGAGNDLIYGDAEALLDFAVGGADRVNGGGGDDVLWGDGELLDDATGGRDRFFFSGAFGDDQVLDFRQGEDVLAFQGLEQTDVTITLEGGDTVLTTLGDDSVTLVGFADPLAVGVDAIFV
jgi:serralysin